MLWTKEIAESIKFYTKTLHFNLNTHDEELGWASLSKDDAEIMLSLPNAHVAFKQPEFTGSFYIRTAEVEQLWEAVKEQAKICYPLEDFSYGMREFAIYDNNGYLLQFGKEIN